MTADETIYSSAIAALKAREFHEAERLFKAFLNDHPKHIGALNLLTITLMRMEHFAEAEQFIARAVNLDQRSDVSFYNYGVILQKLSRPKEAIHQFDKAIYLNPNVSETWNNRGAALNDLEEYERALSDFEQAISLNKNFSYAFCNKAKSLNKLGRYSDALTAYERALALEPNLAEAWIERANILAKCGQHDKALVAYGRALALRPNWAEAWIGRGNVLSENRQYEEALAAYDKAIAFQPDSAGAWLGRANQFSERKYYAEASAAYEKALSLKPDLPEAWLGHGNVLAGRNYYDEALAAYDKAIALKPELAGAWLGQANIFAECKRYDEALTAYDKALALKPDLAQVWVGRGKIFTEIMRGDDALSAYNNALALMPELAEAWVGRGNCLFESGDFEQALTAYDKALALKPDLAEAFLGRGNVFAKLNQHSEAFAAYDKAFVLNPNLVGIEGARLHAKMHLCDWNNFLTECKHLISSVESKNAITNPFALIAIPSSSREQMECANFWVTEKYPPPIMPRFDGANYKHDKIRLAYVSGDFHEHATSYLIAGLFKRHDRSRFDLIAVSTGPDDHSEMSQRLKKSFDHFISAKELSDDNITSRIRSLEIDILVDLKGHTRGARTGIFARRPSPVQINYLGYPGTMGASYIDYLIADRIVIQESHRKYYTEKIVYLPGSYQVNDSDRYISNKQFGRLELGLPERAFVFCCFNSNYKITPTVFDCWMRILHRVDGSVIWLLVTNASAISNLRKEAITRGISADRLIFAERMPLATHLARHQLADLFLDTLPCNAHTTASDALWAGLPVLTQIGDTFAGRVAASLLYAIDLPELITRTQEEYETLAIAIATNPSRLAEIRDKLAKNRLTASLFNTQLFARNIERAYSTIYERHQMGLPPEDMSIAEN